MTDSPLRVGMVQRIVPPYRTQLFQLLAQRPELHLTVLHGLGGTSGQYRSDTGALPFDHHGFKGCRLGLSTRRREYKFPFYPALLKHLHTAPYQVLLLEGASNFFNNIFITRICRKKNIPYVVWDAGRLPGDPPRLNRMIAEPLLRRFYRQAAGIVGYGFSARQYFHSLGISHHQIHVAHNSVDTHSLRQEAINLADSHQEISQHREKLFPGCKRVLLFIGAVEQRKRLDLLLSALEDIPDATEWGLLVIGDGAARPALERAASLSRLRKVHFLGHLSDGRGQYFLMADLAVFPGSGSLAI